MDDQQQEQEPQSEARDQALQTMMQEARPSWLEDGLGLRGDPDQRRSGGSINFESSPVFRRPELDIAQVPPVDLTTF
jgi:hypothetical protein